MKYFLLAIAVAALFALGIMLSGWLFQEIVWNTTVRDLAQHAGGDVQQISWTTGMVAVISLMLVGSSFHALNNMSTSTKND
jgi:hypothetical protein